MIHAPLWFSNLIFWSLQVALLVVAAGLLPRLLRIRQPGVLLVYWRAILGIALLLPGVQPWHRMASFRQIAVANFAPMPLPASPATAVSRWHLPNIEVFAEVLAFVILGGIVLRFAILALGLIRLRQFRRSSSPIPQFSETAALLQEMCARVDARADFCLSSHVDSPVTFGVSAPVILLPERFLSMDVRFQLAIACHELLHVRRCDWAHHLAEEFLRATFWFHPGIAWLLSRVRLAREQVVDLEVVRLTQARKPYLEALLEFTNSRASIAAIPAPPFLAERQLVERVALMLKEVRMSRRKLIALLAIISCCLAVVVVLAAWTFPLKAAARAPQNPPKGGVTSVVPGVIGQGVSGGIATAAPAGRGVEGGVAGGIGQAALQDLPNVDVSTIWTDTVKRGTIYRQVRGLGSLLHAENSTNLVARIILPAAMMLEIRFDQNATVDTRKGLVKGHVIELKDVGSGETRAVYIGLDSPLPEGAVADLPVEVAIDIEKIEHTLYVGRPANVPVDATPFASASEFKVVNDGKEAERVVVKLGKPSATTIQVRGGLQAGDKIILSDMSAYDNADRIRLTDEKHLLHH
jgi:beta-lactamase regulating signal transducer with metallopeptidase domain